MELAARKNSRRKRESHGNGIKRVVSDFHLEEIASFHCERWRSLHSPLKVPKMIVLDAERDNPNDEEGKRRQFLRKWKGIKGPDATYERLHMALLKINCREDAESVYGLISPSSDQGN